MAASIGTLLASPPSAVSYVCSFVIQLSWAMQQLYQTKGLNDNKCELMVSAVSSVCDVLERRFNAHSTLQAQFHIQLTNVERAVRLGAEWMSKYCKRSAMSKFFNSSALQNSCVVAKQGLDDALRTLQLEMQAHTSAQIDDLSQQVHGSAGMSQYPAGAPLTCAAPVAQASMPVPAASLGPTFAPHIAVAQPVAFAPPPPMGMQVMGNVAPMGMGAPSAPLQAHPAQHPSVSAAVPMGLPIDMAPSTPLATPPTFATREEHAFLDAAKRFDFERVVEMARRNPALINASPSGRWSALHQAGTAGHVETVRFLLEHGAQTGLAARDGQRAADVTSHPECLRLLHEASRRASEWRFELGEVGIATDIPISLRAFDAPGAELRGAEDREVMYEVHGPPAALSLVQAVCGHDRSARSGFITAAARVSLQGAAARTAAGIPPCAAFFAFAHPPLGIASLPPDTINGFLHQALSAHPDAQCVLHFICLGGYVYFDSERRLVQVNALTAPPPEDASTPHAASSPSARPVHLLTFDGPFSVRTSALEALGAQGRLHDVTLGFIRREGATRYAWIHPAERPATQALADDASWEHGAFVYVNEDGQGIFFSVASGAATRRTLDDLGGAPPPIARTHSQRMSEELGLPLEDVRASIRAEVARISYG